MARLAVALLLTWLCPGALADARVRFGHLTAEDGLSHNWVRSILRDSRGFLWVGTEDGLDRYDGHAFTVYRHVPSDPHSLPSSLVTVLYEDSRKRLWIGSGWGNGGVAWYDRDRDRFVRVPSGPGSGGLSGDRVYAILEDRAGRLWIGTEYGLDRVDVDAGVYEHHPLDLPREGEEPESLVYALHEGLRGRLWVGTGSGLLSFDPETGRQERWIGRDDQPDGPNRTPVLDLLGADDGKIWVASVGGGLYLIDPQTGRQVRYVPRKGDPTSLASTRVRRLARGHDGRLWVGTENGGLNVLDPATGRFTRFLPDLEDPDALTSASIWALHADHQGIVWVGTYNGGLNHTLRQGFDVIRARPGRLSSPHVTSVMEDHRGHLWIGTDGGGLNRMDRRTGRFAWYRHDPHDRATIGSDAVSSLIEDDSGAIWIGGWDGGLSRLDPVTGRVKLFRHEPDDPKSLVSDNVWKLLKLRTGEILVATEDGVDLLDPGRQSFKRLSSLYPEVGAFQTSAAAEGAEGDLWLGRRRQGLQHVDRSSGKVTEYTRDQKDPDKHGYGWITTIHIDHLGNVWFGTNEGLGCLAKGSSQPRHFTSADGLPDDHVASLVEDGSGSLWVGTLQGLSLFVDAARLPAEPVFFNFDVRDGLPGQESAPDAAFRSSSGLLYVGGEHGLSVFNPADIQRNPEPPPVLLTRLSIFNEPVVPGAAGSPLVKSITETDAVTLSRDDALVTFEFAALNLIAPAKNRYAYRLEGVDRDWTRTGNERSATYAHLPPGRYVFRVRASNNDGVWNDGGVSLRLFVKPRWYEQPFVPPLAVALVAIAGVARYRWRVGHLRARARELGQRVEERTLELRSLNEDLEGRVAARTAELAAEKERLAVTLTALRDAGQRFRTVFHGAPMGIAIASPEGRFVEVNDYLRKLLAFSEEEMRATTFIDITHPEDRERTSAFVETVRSGRADAYEMEKRYLKKDGSTVWCRVHATGLRMQEGGIAYWIGIIEDITERKRLDAEKADLQSQLVQAQKMESVGRLAGGIAHDFNNMLHVITGFADLLARRLPGDGQLSRYVSEIQRAAGRARDVTRQLLAFSRRQMISPVPSDLNTLVARMSGGLSRLIGEDVELRVEGAEGLWAVSVDPTQIDQILLNLAVNARDAMPDGGKMTIETTNVRLDETYCRLHATAKPGDYVLLAVSDNGIGMDKETLSRIFEPFFTTKEKGKGTGLGLATVHGIVEQNGGFVNVYSEPGQGTTFRIYLPRTLDENAAAAEAAESPGDMGGGTVLVVEDEESVRRLTAAVVESIGYTVVVAGSGSEAIELCERDEPGIDVVLTDVVMPGMSGRELRDRLERLRPGIRVLFTSGYTGNVIAHHGMLDKGVHFIAKPFGAADLARALRGVLAGHPGE